MRIRRRNGKGPCKGKQRHEDKTAAVAHLISLGGYPYKSYPCKLCYGWHVGRPVSIIRKENAFEKRARK